MNLAEEVAGYLNASVEKHGPRYIVTRGDNVMKFDVHKGRVNWVWIRGSSGWLGEAHELVRNVLSKRKIFFVEADGGEEDLERLQKYAPWEEVQVEGRRKFRWGLD